MTNQGTKGTKIISDTGKIVDYNNDQFFKFKRAAIPIDQLDKIVAISEPVLPEIVFETN